MKRRIFIAVLVTLCTLVFTAGVVACNDKLTPTHTHNYQWVDNGDGTHKQHCSVDGCDAPDINIGNHDFSDGNCICGKAKPEDVHEHTMEHHNRIEAGCEIDGNVEYWRCSSCDKYFADEDGNSELDVIVIPATGHKWSVGTVTVESGCTTDGNRRFVCENCEKVKNEPIPAAHSWGDWTFFNDDLHTRTCVNCGATDEPAEHDWKYNSCEACDTTVTEFSAGMKYAPIKLGEELVGYSVCGIGTASDTDLVIPSTHNELPVLEIADKAFENCNTLVSVVIPNSVEIIGYAAFTGCSAIQSMTIPFVGGIPDSGGRTELFGYIFGEARYDGGMCIYQYYGEVGFNVNGGEVTYYIPSGLTKITVTQSNIPEYAFRGCVNVREIVLREGIKRIRRGAFYNCRRLTTLSIPDSVVYVGSGAFNGCDSLRYTAYNSGKYFGSVSNPYHTLVDITDKNIRSFTAHNNTKCTLPIFTGYSNLSSLSIPNGITSVQSNGNDNNLVDFVKRGAAIISWGCVYIGNNANPHLVLYSSRYWNVDIKILDDTKVIAANALSYRGYTNDNLIIPDNVQYVGENNIIGSTDVQPAKTVTIGSGVLDMDYAFTYKGSTNSYLEAFSVSSGNKYYASQDGVLYDKACTKLLNYPANKTDEDFTIPSTVKTVCPLAFYSVAKLKNLTIPAGVISVGYQAFDDQIVREAFTSITVDGDNNKYSSQDGILYNKAKTEILKIPPMISGEVTIADGITIIGDSLFANCGNITAVNIPNGVTSIEFYAFANCIGLESITVPDSVKSIEASAFYKCTGLTTATLGNGLEEIVGLDRGTIYQSIFAGCTNLTRINLGSGLTSIGNKAFYDCEKLEGIYFPDMASYAKVDNVDLDKSIVYVNNVPLTEMTKITIPDGVTRIGSWAFSNCTMLADITLPDSVTSVGSYAFDGTAWYDKQADGLIYIGKIAYKYKGEMPENTSLTIADGTKGIAGVAFGSRTSLIGITIPDSVVDIGSSAFSGASIAEIRYAGDLNAWCNINGLEGLMRYGKDDKKLYIDGNEIAGDLVIPDGVSAIKPYAFAYLGGITGVTTPKSVTSIGDHAFAHCGNIESVTISEGVTAIGLSVFTYCQSLVSVTIPNSVTSIGISAFSYSKLTSVVIPDGVTVLSRYMFSHCDNLTEVTLPESLREIENDVFSGCSALTRIVISRNVTKIGSNAFLNCDNITVYCEAEVRPVNWAWNWTDSDRPVVWGYNEEL